MVILNLVSNKKRLKTECVLFLFCVFLYVHQVAILYWWGVSEPHDSLYISLVAESLTLDVSVERRRLGESMLSS